MKENDHQLPAQLLLCSLILEIQKLLSVVEELSQQLCTNEVKK